MECERFEEGGVTQLLDISLHWMGRVNQKAKIIGEKTFPHVSKKTFKVFVASFCFLGLDWQPGSGRVIDKSLSCSTAIF